MWYTVKWAIGGGIGAYAFVKYCYGSEGRKDDHTRYLAYGIMIPVATITGLLAGVIYDHSIE